MTSNEAFHISAAGAEAYEAAFVPAFFAQWVPPLLDLAEVGPGQRVLDVACGTGVVARGAAERTGDAGIVTGLDLNPAMLAVARRLRPDLTWCQGDAADLPFPIGSFNAVLCQMALMFLPDRIQAVREMVRVLAPGGVVAIAVPAALPEQEAFAPFVAMAARHAGPAAATLLCAYFGCGDRRGLITLLADAGLHEIAARTVTGRYRFPSVDAAVTTEVESTPLRSRIDEDTYARIRRGAGEVWAAFTAGDGALDAPFATYLLAGRKPIDPGR
jgi:SAM-dependent methyltransferase